jgi:hypothetical protein
MKFRTCDALRPGTAHETSHSVCTTNGLEREPSLFLRDHGDGPRRGTDLDRYQGPKTPAPHGELRDANRPSPPTIIRRPTSSDVGRLC